MKILHIDSSILGDHSVSRELSSEIVERQKSLYPGATVIRRDLATDPTLHLSGAHMAAFQGGTVEDANLGEDLATGGAFIGDLFDADLIVIGAPMYNFTIPTQLKSWVDRIVVAGRTFQYTEAGPVGLIPEGKKVFVASSRGGVYTGDSPAAALEHHESYLLGVLSFIGLKDVTVIRAEGVGISEDAKANAIARAKEQIFALVCLIASPSIEPAKDLNHAWRVQAD